MPLVTAHARFPHFFNALNPTANPGLFTSWKGEVMRQSVPRWVSRPYRFTGAGSVHAGGRWNVKGIMPTMYASTDPDTLNAEAHYKGRRYGWTSADFKTQTTIGMHWELQAIVDLTSQETLRALKVNHKELVSADWEAEQAAGAEALTQAIGRAAFEHLAEGLIVPSARRKGGVNIVFYPSHRRDGTVIQTLDEANIPFFHGL